MPSPREEITAVATAFEADQSKLSPDEIKLKYLSSKGLIRELFSGLGVLAEEDRKLCGQQINELRERINNHTQAIATHTRQSARSVIDITRQPYGLEKGTRHPINIMLAEAVSFFKGMGFEIIDDVEIETVEYCFEKLRTPEWHPARDTQDTFYLAGRDDLVLRTQTTATQAKLLETRQPPIRALSLGKVYRSDTADATHSPMFHQIEGVVIDENITFGNLKAVLESFVRTFAPNVKEMRFRPHYFSYTEPSAELDVQCTMCAGNGCSGCKGKGWIEMLGCGMVHPELLARLDQSKEYSGFAFGLGLERLIMQRYGVSDIRDFFENDLRILRQITH